MDEKEEGKKLVCQNCSNEWIYRGNNDYYATCPTCLRKVKVINSEEGEDGK